MQRDIKEEEIQYVIIGEEGPDHDKRFIVEVRIGEKTAGTGKGQHKKSGRAGGSLPCDHRSSRKAVKYRKESAKVCI